MTGTEGVEHLDFDAQRSAARSADGWLQGRYYSSDGLSVREFLSFNEVFEICPFEVGVNRAADRRRFRETLGKLTRILELSELLPRTFQTLSNGEMRRVLLARAVLRRPAELVIDDPMAGLDPVRRERFKKLIGAISRDGVRVRLRCRHRDERPDSTAAELSAAARPARGGAARPRAGAAEAVVELRGVSVRFGRRWLLRGLDWTVRRGERWVLKGRNGSGKTTILAMITGDSPLGYANDVRVFGVRRGEGGLADVRRRIGSVSPEMQMYGDLGPEELLDRALASGPELLLLDEPCLNLGAAASRRLLRKAERWLARHPEAAAICVAHRPDHVPAGFSQVLDLDAVRP